MHVLAGSDTLMDIGPGSGEEGGCIVVCDTPVDVAKNKEHKTAVYLRMEIGVL